MPNTPLTRRDWLSAAGGLAVALAARPVAAFASAKPTITIYKSPTCGCCAKWVDHVRAAGFVATVHDTEGMDAIKKKYGVPAALQSCHTALVGSYVVEGHVPAADVLKLLRETPKDVRGVAVPGMPSGSPGMETGGPADRFDVVAFRPNGTTAVFAKH